MPNDRSQDIDRGVNHLTGKDECLKLFHVIS